MANKLIDFIDNKDGCLFTTTVQRKAVENAAETLGKTDISPETLGKTPVSGSVSPESTQKSTQKTSVKTPGKTPGSGAVSPESTQKTSVKNGISSETPGNTSEKTITLPKSTQKTPGKTNISLETPRKTPESGSVLPESTQKTTQKIMDIMRRDPAVTRAELAQSIGITGDAVKKQIRKLKAEGIIKRIGPDKGGYWDVIEKDDEIKSERKAEG